ADAGGDPGGVRDARPLAMSMSGFPNAMMSGGGKAREEWGERSAGGEGIRDQVPCERPARSVGDPRVAGLPAPARAGRTGTRESQAFPAPAESSEATGTRESRALPAPAPRQA